jgi:hypothetical protein
MIRAFRWTLALSVAACAAVTASAAGELSDEEKAAGFVPLFNKADLTGWRFTGSEDSPPKVLPENWQV